MEATYDETYVNYLIDKDILDLNYIDFTELYNISDLKLNKIWNYQLPTITTYYKKKLEIFTIDGFISSFNKLFPIFSENFNFDNIIIAGGSISNILTQNFIIKDIDIFIYGLTKEQAKEKLLYIIDILKPTKIIIKDNYIDIYVENIKYELVSIQIILKLYKSINEILYTFDLGSSAVGFDGKRLYFTSMSKFTYETMCNIVSENHISLSYEFRLLKYLRNGFNIILPKLDKSKIKGYRFKLPYLPEIIQDKSNENLLSISKYDINEVFYTNKYKSFYEDNAEYINNMSKSFTNIKHIINNRHPIIYIENIEKDIPIVNKLKTFLDEQDKEKIKELLLNYTGLTEKNINDIYIKHQRLIPISFNMLIKNYNLYSKYFDKEYLLDVFSNAKLLTNNNEKFKEQMKNICEKQTLLTSEKVKEFIENNPIIIINWISHTENEKIFKPFNPVNNPNEWYGNYKLN